MVVNLPAAQEGELCDLGFRELKVVTKHCILDVLKMDTEERRKGSGQRQGGKEAEKEGREGGEKDTRP